MLAVIAVFITAAAFAQSPADWPRALRVAATAAPDARILVLDLRDGRLLAFFSTRKSGDGAGMYVLSLKRWTTLRLSSQVGESLRWAPLPP